MGGVWNERGGTAGALGAAGSPIRLGLEPELWPLTLDVGAGYLWAGPSGNLLWRIDPATEEATRFEVPEPQISRRSGAGRGGRTAAGRHRNAG